jgi:ABC-2 type transport system ATP-binding protein
MKGMRQRVLPAAAAARSDLLVLDEPLSPRRDRWVAFRALLALLSAEGRMVLFSSHRLDVVQHVCSRVVILSRGRIVAEEDVRRRLGGETPQSLEEVFIAVTAPDDYSALAREIFDVVRTA